MSSEFALPSLSGVTLSYLRLAEADDELPADEADWLTAAERRELSRYRAARRQKAWLCGRWLAKQLVAAGLDRQSEEPSPRNQPAPHATKVPVVPSTGGVDVAAEISLDQIEILSRDGEGRGIAPVVQVAGRRDHRSLSISHTDRGVVVALANRVRVGVDLVDLGGLDPAALGFWFTEQEKSELDLDNRHTAAILWAAKEAVFKATNGSKFVPQQIQLRHRGMLNGASVCLPGMGTVHGENVAWWTFLLDAQIAAVAITHGRGARGHRRVRDLISTMKRATVCF
jgi:phosphopantetheinyl transferase